MNIFRYPGGKSKVVKRIMSRLDSDMNNLCDVFTGGGSVALAYAQQHPTAQIWMNDRDQGMADFWRLISIGDIDGLCSEVLSTEADVDIFKALQERPVSAFAALYLNRTSFSGKSHTSPVGGWEQAGKWKISAEWRQAYLVGQIRRATAVLADRTLATNADWRIVLDAANNWQLYLDPPYYKAGPTMYRHSFSIDDHAELAERLRGRANWLLSYDDHPEVRQLYSWAHIQEQSWIYSTDSKSMKVGQELFIAPEPIRQMNPSLFEEGVA